MSKLLKSLIIGSVLSTVTPINFSSIGFSSSNINDNINDEEEIKIENKETKYDGVLAYAKEKGIKLDKLRGDSDTSGTLGPKYNGGSWNEAAKLVYNIKLDEKTFVKNGEIDEMETTRKSLATMIEYVSIGKKLDFSNGYEQMVKAIVAYMNAEYEKSKTNIRGRCTDEATGVRYIAAAVVQEMLINLHKGRFLCALNENYKDACGKVEETLNTWVQKQLNTENVSLGKKTYINKYDSFSKLKPDERSKQIESLVEYVYRTVFDGNSIRCGESFTRPSSVESRLQKYLRNCTINGMTKLKQANINAEGKLFENGLRVDTLLYDTVAFAQSVNESLESAAKVENVVNEVITANGDARDVCLNNIQNTLSEKKDSELKIPGKLGIKINIDETQKLDEYLEYTTFIKLRAVTYESYLENAGDEQPYTIASLNKFLDWCNKNSVRDVALTENSPIRDLVRMMAQRNELLKISLFDSTNVIKYQQIFEKFSNSTLQELNELCVDNSLCDWWTSLEKNTLSSHTRSTYDIRQISYRLNEINMSGFLDIINNELKKLIEEDKAFIDKQITLSTKPTLGEIKSVILDDELFDKFMSVCQRTCKDDLMRNVRIYMNDLYEDPQTNVGGFLQSLPFVRPLYTKIYDEYKFTAEELDMLEQLPFENAFDVIKKFYIGKLLKSCCSNGIYRKNGNYSHDTIVVFGEDNLKKSMSDCEKILKDWQKYILDFQDRFLQYLKELSWQYCYFGNLLNKTFNPYVENENGKICWIENQEIYDNDKCYLLLSSSPVLKEFVPSFRIIDSYDDLKSTIESRLPEDCHIREVEINGKTPFSSNSDFTIEKTYRVLGLDKLPLEKNIK